MIPSRLILRALSTNLLLIPTGVRIVRRTQATLLAGAPSSFSDAASFKSPIDVVESPNKAKVKKKRKTKSDVQEPPALASSPPPELLQASEGTETRKKKKRTETGGKSTGRVKAAKESELTGTTGTKKKSSKGSKDGINTAEAVGAPPTPKAIILRDYQKACIDAVLDHVKEGHKRLAISLATGAGKTVIFTQLIDKLSPLNENATQTLILVHRKELLEQALRHCMHAYPDKTVEVEMANKHASGVADITVASIQSIARKDRIEKFNPKNFKLILIDECHHAVADTYMQTLNHFGALHPEESNGEHPVVVGVTATLSRHDGMRLSAVLDHIVYHKDYLDLIKDNYLAGLRFTTVQTHVDLSAVRQTRGDFNIGDLSEAVNTNQANTITVKAWLSKAAERKSTLVFCVDIAHVTEMTNTFRKHGIDARFVTSLTSKEDRSRLLDDFRAGVFPVLVNCGILTEGTDIPNIDCVLLARPTRSRNLLIQMIGRGMRLSPGKEGCHVIDMIGVLNRGIISTPTLFGLDPFAIVNEATPDMLKEEAAKKEQGGPEILRSLEFGDANATEKLRNIPIKHISFTDYESIWDLLSDTSHEKQIRQISPYAWIKVGAADYVLSATGTTLRISRQEDGKYTVLEKSSPQWNSFAQQYITRPPRVIAEGVESLDHAVSGADTYATEHCPRNMILHSAPWRKTPASTAQINHLKKMKPEGDWDQKQLTKGQAGDILTRMKYGFSSFEKALKQAKKAKEAEAKLLEAKQRHEIKVGRLL